jgi:hypothetical protein
MGDYFGGREASIDARLKNLDAFAGDCGAADAADQFFALAGEHGTADRLDPTSIVNQNFQTSPDEVCFHQFRR